MSLLRMLVKKKNKENLNSSESDQQSSTKNATNAGPSTGFPTQEESGNQFSGSAVTEICCIISLLIIPTLHII